MVSSWSPYEYTNFSFTIRNTLYASTAASVPGIQLAFNQPRSSWLFVNWPFDCCDLLTLPDLVVLRVAKVLKERSNVTRYSIKLQNIRPNRVMIFVACTSPYLKTLLLQFSSFYFFLWPFFTMITFEIKAIVTHFNKKRFHQRANNNLLSNIIC